MERKSPEIIDVEDDSSESSDTQYDVEAIRAWRYNRKTKSREYLVKWMNWPESANSWEPEDNMNCPAILRKYRKSLPRKERKLLKTKFPHRLNGIQRNAELIKLFGADGPHDSDNEESNKADKQKFYLLVRFKDQSKRDFEEIKLRDFLERYPRETLAFFESRLLAR